MTDELMAVVGRRTGARVVVVGDVLLDGWLDGHADRLCREGPVPVVDVDRARYTGGGAANTAANLAALGADVQLIAVCGEDDAGFRLRSWLDEVGVQARLVSVAGRRTPCKRRLVTDGQLVARFDEAETAELPAAAEQALIDEIANAVEAADAVVACDYANGTASDRLIRSLARPHRRGLLAVDAHDLHRWKYAQPDLVTPSAAEVARLLGEPVPSVGRTQWARERLNAVREATGAAAVAITLDVEGTVAIDATGTVSQTRTRPVSEAYASGAGDSYLAGLVVAQLNGADWADSARLAQAAAEAVLDSTGTGVADATMVRDRLAAGTPSPVSRAVLADRVAAVRRAGGRIVFTNGCFDVLHRGHVACLEEAAGLGDLLIVAVNSDESVRRLKGPERPVTPEADRAAVLAALSCVDCVVVFDDDRPEDLLRLVRPDVYVKGGDYPPDLIPEATLVRQLGGEVRALEYLPDRSTSAIIDRIRAGERIQGAGERLREPPGVQPAETAS